MKNIFQFIVVVVFFFRRNYAFLTNGSDAHNMGVKKASAYILILLTVEFVRDCHVQVVRLLRKFYLSS